MPEYFSNITIIADLTLIWYVLSRYSWPNVVLRLFGGFLLDRVFGIRLGTIISCLFITGGKLIFALGMIDAAQRRN